MALSLSTVDQTLARSSGATVGIARERPETLFGARGRLTTLNRSDIFAAIWQERLKQRVSWPWGESCAQKLVGVTIVTAPSC
jgi:hypothetical protein